jgi:hypothetical protein
MIGRLARLAGGHVGGAKFLEGLEDAGLQQRQKIIELDEIILHRRCRQHPAVARRDDVGSARPA